MNAKLQLRLISPSNCILAYEIINAIAIVQHGVKYVLFKVFSTFLYQASYGFYQFKKCRTSARARTSNLQLVSLTFYRLSHDRHRRRTFQISLRQQLHTYCDVSLHVTGIYRTSKSILSQIAKISSRVNAYIHFFKTILCLYIFTNSSIKTRYALQWRASIFM